MPETRVPRHDLLQFACNWLRDQRKFLNQFNKKKGNIIVNIIIRQWKLKVKLSKLPKARENAGDQVVIGFRFSPDWLRKWSEFSGPITERSKESQCNLGLLSFNIQLKTALCQNDRYL